MRHYLKTLCSTKDVIFSSSDMKPFLYEPLVFAHLIKEAKKARLNVPDFYTYDHDWNGE